MFPTGELGMIASCSMVKKNAEPAMPLTPSDSPYLYEPLLGILHFKMLDGPSIVHCMGK